MKTTLLAILSSLSVTTAFANTAHIVMCAPGKSANAAVQNLNFLLNTFDKYSVQSPVHPAETYAEVKLSDLQSVSSVTISDGEPVGGKPVKLACVTICGENLRSSEKR